MFAVSNQNDVHCVLSNWCICINLSCGPRRPDSRSAGRAHTQSYISKGIQRQGIGSFVRHSYVSRLCPVVMRPYLCTSERFVDHPPCPGKARPSKTTVGLGRKPPSRQASKATRRALRDVKDAVFTFLRIILSLFGQFMV